LAHQNFEERFKQERVLTIPELILIAGTRVALGVGIGLLIADKLTDKERKAAGGALVGVGALSTVPIALNVFGKPVAETGNDGRPSTKRTPLLQNKRRCYIERTRILESLHE
jgi:hypothetical protein